MTLYYYKVINATLPAEVLERKLNAAARRGYAILAVSSQGQLIILGKERKNEQ